MTRLRLPEGPGLTAVAAGLAVWMGAFSGLHLRSSAVAVAGVALGLSPLVVGRRRPVLLAGCVLVGAVSGAAAAHRSAAVLSGDVPEGRVRLTAAVVEDPVAGRGDPQVLVRPLGAIEGGEVDDRPLLLVGGNVAELVAGQRVVVEGLLRARPGAIRGDPYVGRLAVKRLEVIEGGESVLFAAGNALRRRVTDELATFDGHRAAALLAGFLIGDTSGLSDRELESLRRSGLTHFVAVSGSNVALFLAAWWVVTAPLSMSPRLRGWIGLAGLALFVVVTRWEASVLRAATMAGLVLGARAMSVPIDGWTALGGAAVVLLTVSGNLAGDVGFQLSAAATAGVLAGAGAFRGRRPAPVWTALAASVSAQIAVMPLLLLHFGTVPLLAPLANLLAAPLVTASTALGGVGVVGGIDLLTRGGVFLAGGVLRIADVASDWPQLGTAGVALAAAVGAAASRRSLRPLVAVGVSAVLVATNLVPAAPPAVPTVSFLDVGQGDAVLLRDATGTTVLVDAGREPRLLQSLLEARGIQRIDLLVATHGDVDHVGGMDGLADEIAVARLWYPDHPELGEVLPDVMQTVGDRGGIVTRPGPGTVVTAGAFRIEVIGPLRRYQAENDGSLVLWVEASGRSVLLPGDIGAVAQRELPVLRPDVLLVPHHGSSTTDPGWLAATVGEVAVVSVGDNTYGHPAPEIMRVLLESGAELFVTQDLGDVDVPLGGG